MYFTLKESKITAWWVAKKNDLMAFYNICANEELPNDLVVVGTMKDSYPALDLAESSNNVVSVSEHGVITAKGSFYPLEEAHASYINFLVNANTTNKVIAVDWKLVRGIMTADILRDGEMKKGVTFDFKPYHWNRNDVGYSDKLKSDVVVSPFSRRGVCIKLCIPTEVKSEIYHNAEFSDESEKTEYIDLVRGFINRRGSCDRGHVGEWIEELVDIQFGWVLPPDQYTPLSKKQWSRICTRCGAKEVTEVEPKEVTRAKKEKEIKELEERIRKLKSEL